MYVIVAYDINTKRVNKVHKVLKQYLNWIQNSVFEGEITKSKLKSLKNDLKTITDITEDSIIYLETPTKNDFKVNVIGIEKNKFENIL
ncbi:CRISPR-associated endonuclease Cas2 [Oceanotoga sp. DSM 15011]|jgi:CRISPR-associated protein Cas2|uniref:CRISPR-associated endonuclease Cas2 n=1 Tax=Oceanotoga TaxID=1255275 RepID=UPI0021F3E155|nr:MULTISPECIES: CRISPR-associated endonuclease Cas2 [Oceanotoga]MDO7976495.1 CRISPR-associated endonuclease Cas2 [Oceanotoga teriensis]UYP01291.1 CRISPR-associated endonuclease Cas2 [Oceanotoga sp. DSM 15011]